MYYAQRLRIHWVWEVITINDSIPFSFSLFYFFRHTLFPALAARRNFDLIKATVATIKRSQNDSFSASGKEGEKRDILREREQRLTGEITHSIINLITTRESPSLSYVTFTLQRYFSFPFFFFLRNLFIVFFMQNARGKNCESDWTRRRYIM